MGEVSAELVKLLQTLLPGFLTAWIYYALTAHRKPAQFERVIQALVFTSIIQVILIPTKLLLLWIGRRWALADWTDNAEFLWSWFLALVLGLIFSWFTTQDTVHRLLRFLGFTTKTSHPSQWYGTFKETKTDIILNMKSGRRLRGWPFEWPDYPDEGQFRLCDAGWLQADGSEISLQAAEFVVVAATDVELVEFLKLPDEAAAIVESPCSPKQTKKGNKKHGK